MNEPNSAPEGKGLRKPDGTWWCCRAEFGQHERDCSNFDNLLNRPGTRGLLGRCDLKQYEHCGDHKQIKERGQKLPPFPCRNWIPVKQESDCQSQPVEEADESRQRLMPSVLDRYAEDLERNHTPTDSGLPFALRKAASMLREMQEVTELLDTAGEATGNEHRRYALIERIRNLITTKLYAWRQRDKYEALNKEMRMAFLLVAECDYDNERKIKDVAGFRKFIEDNYP